MREIVRWCQPIEIEIRIFISMCPPHSLHSEHSSKGNILLSHPVLEFLRFITTDHPRNYGEHWHGRHYELGWSNSLVLEFCGHFILSVGKLNRHFWRKSWNLADNFPVSWTLSELSLRCSKWEFNLACTLATFYPDKKKSSVTRFQPLHFFQPAFKNKRRQLFRLRLGWSSYFVLIKWSIIEILYRSVWKIPSGWRSLWVLQLTSFGESSNYLYEKTFQMTRLVQQYRKLIL